jgi:hypothetical protein
VTWDGTPTFILDQWNCETNGSEVAVELGQAGSFATPRDGVSGALEFTVYALALGLTVESIDASYLATYTQFREFLAWEAERAMGLYRIRAPHVRRRVGRQGPRDRSRDGVSAAAAATE